MASELDFSGGKLPLCWAHPRERRRNRGQKTRWVFHSLPPSTWSCRRTRPRSGGRTTRLLVVVLVALVVVLGEEELGMIASRRRHHARGWEGWTRTRTGSVGRRCCSNWRGWDHPHRKRRTDGVDGDGGGDVRLKSGRVGWCDGGGGDDRDHPWRKRATWNSESPWLLPFQLIRKARWWWWIFFVFWNFLGKLCYSKSSKIVRMYICKKPVVNKIICGFVLINCIIKQKPIMILAFL